MSQISMTKRKFLQQITQQKNQPIPVNVKRICQRAFCQSFSLEQKFRNLEDPLSYIHNQHIQDLVDKTQQTTLKLRRQMEETSQFSKSMYKKIISRGGNQFSFDKLDRQKDVSKGVQNDQSYIMKTQKILRNKQPRDLIRQLQQRRQMQHQNAQKLKRKQGQKQYKHQMREIQSTGNNLSKQQLTYDQIKLVGTPEFQLKCRNYQFYELLRQGRRQKHKVSNQQFSLDTNVQVQRHMEKLGFSYIYDSCEYNKSSQDLFFNFEKNLGFWMQQPPTTNSGLAGQININNQKFKDEKVLSIFSQFSKKQIGVNNVCDVAMGKITCQMLNLYQDLKMQHTTKLKIDKNNENLDEMYNKLSKQYQYAHQLKIKSKAQRIPVKYIETQCQTIRLLQQKQFDDYFNQNIKQIFLRIGKLNSARQKAMINKKIPNKLIVLKNACEQINECLFKTLILILKGEKFYPRNQQNMKNFAPFFTYSDLFNVQSRKEVQNRVLELIYTKINEFQCEIVDGVQKSRLIEVYVQQKQKNNKILEIINGE